MSNSILSGFMAACAVVCGPHVTQAQNLQHYVMATAGASSHNIAGFVIDFTVGEPVTNVAAPSTGITLHTPACTQGFEQPLMANDFPQVALLQFMGRPEKGYILLEWTTVHESDNDFFYIERSIDGIVFGVIGRVPSKATGGASMALAYGFTDLQPANGNNYYRLRQVSKNGAISYSNTIVIPFNLPVWNVHVWPNPVRNQLQLKLYTDRPGNYALRLVNMMGQVMMIQHITASLGYNTYTLNTAWLKAGIYILFFHDNTHNDHHQIKILKD